MSEFKTGDRVEVVKSTVEDLNGMFGVIKGKGDGWHWWVTLEGGSQSLGFDSYELAPASAPTGDGAADVSRDTQQRNILFSRVQNALDIGGFSTVAEDFRNYRNLAQKQIQERDAEIAALRSQLSAAQAALKPFDTLWSDWFAYCMSGDSKYHNILQWLIGEHSVDKVADLIRIASDKLRAQLGQQDVG